MENLLLSKPGVKGLLAISCMVLACLGLLLMGSHTTIAAGGFTTVDIGANEFTLLCDLPGDVNCDCAVDIEDIMLVASRWGCECGNECYDPRYDLDEDCHIDIADIMLVAAHWGDTCPPPNVTPTISNLTTNLADYPNGQVPRYEKLEVTFEVNTVAETLQLPYDPSPPPGLEPGIGITVNALFTPDNWQTVYTQPAFYYQEFQDEIKGGKEWFYPTGNFFWKVRFAPNQAGEWQYKLIAQDASGITETQSQSFTVIASSNKGFIRASQRDPRYFEYEDGTYFPALGYNMDYNRIDWVNPRLSNEGNFQKMQANGIQVPRMWLSQWSIFTSAWNPWYGIRSDYGGVIPRSGLIDFIDPSTGTTSIKLKLAYSEDANEKNTNWFDACRFIGGFQAPPAVKQNTKYHIKIKYQGFNISGPRNTASPNYGFVAKVQDPNDGNWHTDCYESGVGVVVTDYGGNTNDWAYLEGEWSSGNRDFLPIFYLVLENVNAVNPATGKTPAAYIDYVWIQEDLGNNQYGPNIVSKPSMEHHLYFEQRNSYAFDKVVKLAKQYDIYLRPVILEKNERILNRIDYEGNLIPDDSRCWDEDQTNDPEKCPGDNKWFYGNWRQVTEVRWLQQAWWRYLQARWGYSTNIHSWELLNEGDPWNGLHYTLTDEFGKYMHQFTPNDHLVSTSNWHSFPKDNFWANSEYPDVDLTDLHAYATDSLDTADNTHYYSMRYGAKQPEGAGKPLIRGETGFSDEVTDDPDATWLHNYIWGGINPGGMIESYWYATEHIYTGNFDHRDQYGNYYDFIKDVPLNNGNYQDAQAQVSNGSLRAWGQKDLVNESAHLWIQNKNHTWKNVVDGISIPEVSGEVTISGFAPGKQYTLEWWDTHTGSVSKTEPVTTDGDGNVQLQISNLQDDLAVKILNPD